MQVSLTTLIQVGLDGLMLGGVYSLVAIGLTLIWGVMKIVNFAHGEFMMLAMYLSYWSFTLLGINPYLSILLNIPLMFILGALVQKTLIDRVLDSPHHIQILLTVGLGLLLENVVLYLWSPDYRIIDLKYLDATIRIADVSLGLSKLIAFLSSIFFAAVLYGFLKKTTLGRAMRAVADEREGAFLVGINVGRIYTISFGLAAACVGVAGALVIPFFYTHPRVGLVFILMSFSVVVIGSMGNFIGALIGGLIIGLTESFAAFFLPGTLKLVAVFTIFILVLLFKPMGLFGKSTL